MSRKPIDKSIHDTCQLIDANIESLANSNVNLLSQNILSNLRNLIEHVAIKLHNDNQNLTNDYEQIKQAIVWLKGQGQLKWLAIFHNFTQASVSHYSPDPDNAYRLMLKYYEYILKIKQYFDDEYNLKLLNNIDQFPIKQNSNSQEFYKKIVEKIENSNCIGESSNYNDRYYIQGKTPFFIDGKIYYQITYTTAHDNVSKFDRIIAFTNLDIPSNYAVNFSVITSDITVFNQIQLPIKVIRSYEISIRPCEIDNLAKIFNQDTKNKGSTEKKNLSKYLV